MDHRYLKPTAVVGYIFSPAIPYFLHTDGNKDSNTDISKEGEAKAKG